MNFKDLNTGKLSYNTLCDDVINDFYIPCLEQAKVYKRAVGYFSSNVLIQISRGLGSFVDNGGKIQLLVSPKLEQGDYEAIKNGYELKDYVTQKMINDFDFDIDIYQRDDRFEMLAYMISHGILDIKIVVVKENYNIGMFHRKTGIFIDKDDNRIAFAGSANETFNGYFLNDEEIEVYYSWISEDNYYRCAEKEMSFDNTWIGQNNRLITIPFPDVIKNKLLKYENKNSTHLYSTLDDDFEKYIKKMTNKKKEIAIPSDIILHDYQEEAIRNWKNNNFRGIFDMATGTGKTITALSGICKLYSEKKRIFVVICCPYRHLVDQRCEEVKKFGMTPLKCYGDEKYEKSLEREVNKFKQRRTNFSCIIITNSSFKKQNVQLLMQKNLNNTLLVVDEAHNFGAYGTSKTLAYDYKYRLALSATLERKGDEFGTNILYEFFGNKCIEYTLDKAIQEGKLTPYKYYPVIVSLTEDEYSEYVRLSKLISKYRNIDGEISEAGKKLLIKRARLVAGAQGKIEALKKVIEPYKNAYNLLIYCGAVKYGQYGYNQVLEEERQIDNVLAMLNGTLNMIVAKFTSDESTIERENILNAYKNNSIQGLVAIKCLDEGVNIPSIKTAFILASSTNPKEYIQRRGRVLRKSKDKTFSEIFDFVVLPREIGTFKNRSENHQIDKTLVRKELSRVIDFSNLSDNPSFSNGIIKSIQEYFNIDIYDEGDDLYA